LALYVVAGSLMVAIWGIVSLGGWGLLLGALVPVGVLVWIKAQTSARRRAFSDQLPDNLQMVASALRAGHSFGGALATMVKDAAEPSKTEFQRAVTDEQLGVGIDDTLKAVATRMHNQEVEYVGIVARMQRDTGGNTAEVLDHVVETVRERHRLKRMVRTLTAQSRMGAVIISIMPVAVALAMSALHPGYFDPMLEKTAGLILLFVCSGMLMLGWFVIYRIVRTED
jgi:tight adherence protein B